MKNNLSLGLSAELQYRLELILEACAKKNVIMHVIEGVRNPFLQAAYWRQSRKIEEIKFKIDELNACKAFFLAYCIGAIGPQHGKFVTNAIPGFSWHQWGEAVDCVWVINGKRCWDLNLLIDSVNGYHIYAEEAKSNGLDSGFYWPNFQDACHIQLRSSVSPDNVMSIEEIDELMRIKFEHLVK